MAWGLAQISSQELSEWMAMYQLEPWDEGQAEWRAGMIASTVANSVRGKDSKVLQPVDFMRAQFKGEEVQQKPESQEQLVKKIDSVFAMLGGKRGDIIQ